MPNASAKRRSSGRLCKIFVCRRDWRRAERDDREQRYTALCREMGKEPEPLSPPLSPEDEPSLTAAEDLQRGLQSFLMTRGFDHEADNIKQAIADFVKAVLARQK